jgi:hypothetical protein
LNDLLRLNNDNSGWNGRRRVTYSSPGDDGNGHILNKASIEMSELSKPNLPSRKWTYEYQRKLKSKILRKSQKILDDADLIRSSLKRLKKL